MKYAIIRIEDRQYKVKEGEDVLVDKLNSEKPNVEILLCIEEDKCIVGKPIIAKAKVDYKIADNVKGDKINGLKYKAKSRYRKRFGFRPIYTKLTINKISV